jgi:FXSXX-COOH protein
MVCFPGEGRQAVERTALDARLGEGSARAVPDLRDVPLDQLQKDPAARQAVHDIMVDEVNPARLGVALFNSSL